MNNKNIMKYQGDTRICHFMLNSHLKNAVDSWTKYDTYRMLKSYMYREDKCQESAIGKGSKALLKAVG